MLILNVRAKSIWTCSAASRFLDLPRALLSTLLVFVASPKRSTHKLQVSPSSQKATQTNTRPNCQDGIAALPCCLDQIFFSLVVAVASKWNELLSFQGFELLFVTKQSYFGKFPMFTGFFLNFRSVLNQCIGIWHYILIHYWIECRPWQWFNRKCKPTIPENNAQPHPMWFNRVQLSISLNDIETNVLKLQKVI